MVRGAGQRNRVEQNVSCLKYHTARRELYLFFDSIDSRIRGDEMLKLDRLAIPVRIIVMASICLLVGATSFAADTPNIVCILADDLDDE